MQNAHNFCANLSWKHKFACIWCTFPFVIHSHNSALCAILLHNKKQEKGQFLQTQQKNNISTDKQTADTFLAMCMVLLIIDKCPTFTQTFLLWTECQGKQFQSSIVCYISLWCCCLNLLSLAGLARNKEKKFTQLKEILVQALHFQSQTVHSLQRLQCVSRSFGFPV